MANELPSHRLEARLAKQRFHQLYNEETRLHGINFKPRSTDVIVIGNQKCGTTWMQQIAHQLRTGGDMEFTELTEVVPVLELALHMKIDLYAEQKAFPRCFKSHHAHERCPQGANYIWCLREPCSTAYSYFNMARGWFFQSGELSLEEFVQDVWLKQGKPVTISDPNREGYFHHLVSWWPHRNDANVLLVFFEDLKESYEHTVRKVAAFMNITAEENIQAALEGGTFEYMKKHSDKFDQKTIKKHLNINSGLDESVGVGHSKIRTGSTTEGQKMLSPETRRKIQEKWEEVVTPVTGFSSYAEMRDACKTN